MCSSDLHFSRDPSVSSTARPTVRAVITGLLFVTPEPIAEPHPADVGQFAQVDLALLQIQPLKGAELPVLPTDWSIPRMTRPPVLVVGHPFDNEAYRTKYAGQSGDSALSFDAVFGNQLQCKHASPGYAMPYFLASPRGGQIGRAHV